MRIAARDGSVQVVPLAGELDVAEPVPVAAAPPRWPWWAGCRDDVYVVIRPPVGGSAAWWGELADGLVAHAWVDDRGTVVQRHPSRATARATIISVVPDLQVFRQRAKERPTWSRARSASVAPC